MKLVLKLYSKQNLGFVPDQIAGVAGPLGCGNKFGEQRSSECVFGHALGVPLDADDPTRAASIFDGFDGAIGSMCGDD